MNTSELKGRGLDIFKSRQFWQFVAVGVVNTIIDFSILNFLTSSLGWPIIAANIVSTSVALAFSFTVNSSMVFKGSTRPRRQQLILFILVTVFGLYVLQSGIIYLMTEVWPQPLGFVRDLTGAPHGFVKTNVSKIVASSVTVIWNFIMYKKVVFK